MNQRTQPSIRCTGWEAPLENPRTDPGLKGQAGLTLSAGGFIPPHSAADTVMASENLAGPYLELLVWVAEKRFLADEVVDHFYDDHEPELRA